MSTTPSPSKYTRLTNGQKQELCAVAAANPSWTHAKLIDWVASRHPQGRRPSRTAVADTLKRKHEYTDLSNADKSRKKLRSAEVKKSDADLMEHIDAYKAWHPSGSIRGKTVAGLARHHDVGGPTCKYSRGWLYKFQRRTGLWFAVRHGEAGSVDMDAVAARRARLRRVLASYSPNNIYNMDETAFFFERDPKGTLTTDKTVPGRKQSKTRITLCVATNADGSDRRALHFIGKYKVPVPLRGHDVREELGVTYTYSKKGWMNTVRFSECLSEFNEDMKAQQRRVVLLIDNVSSHNTTEEVEQALSNVRIERLPPNTTAVLQPMDQGVIKCLKDHYVNARIDNELHMFLNNEEYKPIDIYSAMKYCAEGWRRVSTSAIQNTWFHTGLVTKIDISFMTSV